MVALPVGEVEGLPAVEDAVHRPRVVSRLNNDFGDLHYSSLRLYIQYLCVSEACEVEDTFWVETTETK